MKIVIIGGGPGGYVAAIRAAQLNAQVVLVEKDRVGGTCLNRGCIPTKVLLHASRAYTTAKSFESYGIKIKEVELNWTEVQRKKTEIVDKQVRGIEGLLESNNITKIKGQGSFLNKNQLKVKAEDGSETIVDFDYAIIATGSKPVIIPIPGIDLPGVINSDEALNLTELPKSLVIIGGGVIGCEFADIFSALGCKVTIIEMLPNIIANMDQDIVSTLKDKFYNSGVEILTNTKVVSISKAEGGLCVNTESGGNKQSFLAEKVLLSIGRKPVIDNLKLENAGIETQKGAVLVNKNMQTNVPNIYAIGDARGGVMLAHAASSEGIVAVESIMNLKPNIDFKTIPYCVYTRPELAGVGLTEDQAREKGYDVEVGLFPMSRNGKAMIEDEQQGLVKYVTDRATGEVLGLHIAGPSATELIVEGVLALRLEATIDEITSTIHAHPTVGEALHEAAHGVHKQAIHMPR
ncbi:MAG: dihydrolipoyl dehydrogenase [Caldicoprobacterales bacterium]|jgi:dihydrolipoamide dehydrogenase